MYDHPRTAITTAALGRYGLDRIITCGGTILNTKRDDQCYEYSHNAGWSHLGNLTYAVYVFNRNIFVYTWFRVSNRTAIQAWTLNEGMPNERLYFAGGVKGGFHINTVIYFDGTNFEYVWK